MTGRYLTQASFALFLAGFFISVYVFVVVQVLQSYPFFRSGVYGDQRVLVLTYTETLETAAPLSVIGFAAWQYARSYVGPKRCRIACSLGTTLLFFGAVLAVLTYTEIHLLWGEFWYGLHFSAGLPGGGGYPWGDEQVAYNLCFIKEPSYSPATPDCYLLNYNSILVLGMLAIFLGILLRSYGRRDTNTRSPQPVPLPVSMGGESPLDSSQELWSGDRYSESRFLEFAKYPHYSLMRLLRIAR